MNAFNFLNMVKMIFFQLLIILKKLFLILSLLFFRNFLLSSCLIQNQLIHYFDLFVSLLLFKNFILRNLENFPDVLLRIKDSIFFQIQTKVFHII